MLRPYDSFVYSSPSCTRISGHEASEFLGDRELLTSTALEQVRKLGKYHGEFLAVRKDGSGVPIDIGVGVVHDQEGQPFALTAICQDITGRKLAEQQAKHHAVALYARNLIEASRDPMVTISAKGKISDVNKS